MPIRTSSDLLSRLYRLGYDNPSRDPWWWPDSGRFETLIGAILTQNTTWTSVEKSLRNLAEADLLAPHGLAIVPREKLETLIRPSGYYRNKARNLQELSLTLLEDFGDFDTFSDAVTRQWLMDRRGIGNETADAILNYTCYQEAMVVDSYTTRLLEALGFGTMDYLAVQRWMMDGAYEGCSAVFPEMTLAQCYARYHGMVVEYCKVNKKGKSIDPSGLYL